MSTNLNGVYIADAYFCLSREDGDKAESDSIVNQRALVKEFQKPILTFKFTMRELTTVFQGYFERAFCI